MTILDESLQDVLYGSVAGSVGKVIEYPFDTIKVRLQSQPHPPIFSGPLQCFKHTLQQEGITGFYRGVSSPLFGAAAENACLFVAYGLAQDLLKSSKLFPLSHEDDLPISAKVVAGAISGIAASFVLTPIELIKCKMQVQRLYAGTPDAVGGATGSSAAVPMRGVFGLVADTLKTEGIKGLWRGQVGTLLRECGGSASWFGSYEYVGLKLREVRHAKENTTPELLLSGACAGISYNVSLFPADTIKSKMQTESIMSGSGNSNFIQTAQQIYSQVGIRGFYRGMGVTVLRAAPSNAVIFFTYEKLKSWGKTVL